MFSRFSRRDFLQTLAAATAACAAGSPGAQAAGLNFGPPQPFTFDILKQTAARLAAAPHVETTRPMPAAVSLIDYDQWGKIRFDPDKALYGSGPQRFPATFFRDRHLIPEGVRPGHRRLARVTAVFKRDPGTGPAVLTAARTRKRMPGLKAGHDVQAHSCT